MATYMCANELCEKAMQKQLEHDIGTGRLQTLMEEDISIYERLLGTTEPTEKEKGNQSEVGEIPRRRINKAADKKDVMVWCLTCGGEFLSYQPKVKFCCVDCRNEYHIRKRKKGSRKK